MRLRRPTAGERKEGGEGGGKRRGCQGGTVCGSLGSGPLPKIVCMCVSACLFSLSVCCLSQRFTISDLVASVPAKASSGKVGWESFGNWAPFKTSTVGQMLQFQNYVFSLQPQLSKNGLDYLGLFYMLLCTLPAGHDQALDLQYICPLANCKAKARFNAQQ